MWARFAVLAVASSTLLLVQCAPAPPFPAAVPADPVPAFTRGEDVRLRQALASLDAGDAETAWFRFWELAMEGDPAAQVNLAQLYRGGNGHSCRAAYGPALDRAGRRLRPSTRAVQAG